jgi:DNA-binding MarR family transcriptional regulator
MKKSVNSPQEAVLTALAADNTANNTILSAATGWAPRTLTRAIAELHKAGTVDVDFHIDPDSRQIVRTVTILEEVAS